MKEKNLDKTGFYNLPIHRIFAYYITRILLFNKIENN
jgi:hypothetical protein